MANRIINLRLGDKLLKEIDSIVQSETYESRTEFIKESLRKAVDERRILGGTEALDETPETEIKEEPHKKMGKHTVS